MKTSSVFMPWLPRLGSTVSVAGFALLVASCQPGGEAGQGGGGMPPPFVVAVPPTEKTLAEWDQFTGRVEASQSVEIRPRISGYIDSVEFKSGDLVTRDQVLFRIDPRQQQAAVNVAKSTLQQATARLQSAQQEAKRADELEKTKAISAEEAMTRRSGLAVAQSAVAAAQAVLESAELDLSFCTVRSPIVGRVSRELFTAGNNISGVPGFTSLLTTIVAQDPVHVYATVDEASYQKYQRLIREGKLADPQKTSVKGWVALEGDTGFPHEGVIESFDNRIDPASGAILVRLTVPNKEGRITPGSFARVRLPGSPEYKALLIDEKVIRTDQSVKFVFVQQDGPNGPIAGVAPLELGPVIDGQRIVRSGLKATDKIISTNLMMVQPGGPITPAPAQGPGPAGN